MARIEGIRLRLERWSKWCSYREGQALGYPRQNILARKGVRGGGFGAASSASDLDLEASETNDAVESLRLRQSHLHLALTLHYAKGYPIHQVAAKMGRAQSTVKRNLEDADRALEAWLKAKAEAARASWKAVA
jgi:hypothetical protein